MYADIEALVLSGELFNGTSRSSSPARSVSPDHDSGWHDDELISEEQELDYDSDRARRDIFKAQQNAQSESIGMGPGRTGVKGVIRDRDEAAEIRRDKKARELDAIRKKMEASSLGGTTFLEDERQRAAEGEKVDALITKELKKKEGKRGVFGRKREGRFGHLREVGIKGFLAAVENEDKSVWVVVHLYDPSLERCYLVDENLARLARSFSDTKFLRAKASALGFATTRSPRKTLREDDDDEYEDGDEFDSDDDVDLDMLPTMLVYLNGELVYNWVRVDWEAGQAGIEELLDKHHILPHNSCDHPDSLGLVNDEDFDLMWSDDEDINP